jgi:hypothetical protein
MMPNAAKKAALAKMSATCANRLIPRLARHLFGDSNYDKHRVRKILIDGGYPGPGWDDEARAVSILAAAGKDMSKFERSGTVEPVAVAQKPPQRRYTISNLYGPVEAAQPSESAAEKLKNVTIILMQAEKEILREIREGKRKSLGGLSVTVGAALDEIRR